MARVLRGDIFWANLDPVKGQEQAGMRPVVVISQDVFNESSKTVIAVAVTSKPPKVGFPLTLPLAGVNLPKRSWVKISQIRVLSIERLGAKIGHALPDELERIIEGLNRIIGS